MYVFIDKKTFLLQFTRSGDNVLVQDLDITRGIEDRTADWLFQQGVWNDRRQSG